MTCIIIDLYPFYQAYPKSWKKSLPTICCLFWKTFHIPYKYQFGFIHNKNTTHAIFALVDYVINSLENNEMPCSIFLHTSKAFDTIDDEILLNKLSRYGIRGITQNRFKNYLSERYQYVSINNCSSS